MLSHQVPTLALTGPADRNSGCGEDGVAWDGVSTGRWTRGAGATWEMLAGTSKEKQNVTANPAQCPELS